MIYRVWLPQQSITPSGSPLLGKSGKIIIPFSLAYYFLIAGPAPGEMDEGNLFWRLVFLLMILRISMTLFEVPRGALAPELSKDYDQRNTLASLSMMFGWFGGAGIDFIARYYWLDSFVDFDGYQILAFWGGVGIFIGTAVTSIGTHRNIAEFYYWHKTKRVIY